MPFHPRREIRGLRCRVRVVHSVLWAPAPGALGPGCMKAAPRGSCFYLSQRGNGPAWDGLGPGPPSAFLHIWCSSSRHQQHLLSESEDRTPGKRRRASGQVLGLASLSGKEWLADSTRRVNSVPPLSTLGPQNHFLRGHLLSRSEAVFFKVGAPSWLPFAHLATMGFCYCLEERGTWDSQVFTKKLTR